MKTTGAKQTVRGPRGDCGWGGEGRSLGGETLEHITDTWPVKQRAEERASIAESWSRQGR